MEGGSTKPCIVRDRREHRGRRAVQLQDAHSRCEDRCDARQGEQTIEAIRPAIQADGGDIKLHDVNEETGVVTVELVGACVSCPASTVTLKAGIERILKDRGRGRDGSHHQGDDMFEGTPLSL